MDPSKSLGLIVHQGCIELIEIVTNFDDYELGRHTQVWNAQQRYHQGPDDTDFSFIPVNSSANGNSSSLTVMGEVLGLLPRTGGP